MLKEMKFLWVFMLIFILFSGLSMEWPYLDNYPDYSNRDSLLGNKVIEINSPSSSSYSFSDYFKSIFLSRIIKHLNLFLKF